MDLSPLYELRDRLRAGIIAGAALAAEDFRLSRALEGLAPLEKASPVFAKLGHLTRSVLAPDCPDRAGAMLDAITLCDAVLTTQAAVAVPGELESLPGDWKGHTCTSAPYSVVAPLVEALTTSGSGHFSLVQDTLQTRSDLFRDYRVRQAMVKALGASYGELADLIQRYMMGSRDESIIPQLLEGFDPAGKKEMARRVQIIEDIAGAKMNDWYLQQLPEARKAVRGALIYALRHDPKNLDLLLELAKKEKGDCKSLARWALVRTETPGSENFLREQLAKDFENTVALFTCSTTSVATAMTAELFQKELDRCSVDPDTPFPEDEEFHLKLLFSALVGKTGEAVCNLYRRAAAMAPTLDELRVSRDKKGQPVCEQMLFWSNSGRRSTTIFSQALADTLLHSIVLLSADPMLCTLAEELYEQHGGFWAAPLLTATLLTKDRKEAAEKAKKLLASGLIEKLTGNKRQAEVLEMVFGRLCGRTMSYDRILDHDDAQVPAYQLNQGDPATGMGVFVASPQYMRFIPLADHLDGWWCDFFIQAHMDHQLRTLVNLTDPEQRDKVCKYFYNRIRMGHSSNASLTVACDLLMRCGWTEWKGLLSSYAKHTSNPLSYWDFRTALGRIPLTDPEKADELHAVWVEGRFSGWPEKAIEKQLEDWWGK